MKQNFFKLCSSKNAENWMWIKKVPSVLLKKKFNKNSFRKKRKNTFVILTRDDWLFISGFCYNKTSSKLLNFQKLSEKKLLGASFQAGFDKLYRNMTKKSKEWEWRTSCEIKSKIKIFKKSENSCLQLLRMVLLLQGVRWSFFVFFYPTRLLFVYSYKLVEPKTHSPRGAGLLLGQVAHD